MTLLLIAAGIALLLWPSSTSVESSPYVSAPYVPATPRAPTYLDAVSALQTVRHRLVETEQISEAERTAIDSLTLALVRGSER
jgi:hypothetical protein